MRNTAEAFFTAEMFAQLFHLAIRFELCGGFRNHRQKALSGKVIDKLCLGRREARFMQALVHFVISAAKIMLGCDLVFTGAIGNAKAATEALQFFFRRISAGRRHTLRQAAFQFAVGFQQGFHAQLAHFLIPEFLWYIFGAH